MSRRPSQSEAGWAWPARFLRRVARSTDTVPNAYVGGMSEARNHTGGLRFMLRALKYPNYRLYFGGPLISLVGTWLTTVASAIGAPWTLTIAGEVSLENAARFAFKLPALRKLIRPVCVRIGTLAEIAQGMQTTTSIHGGFVNEEMRAVRENQDPNRLARLGTEIETLGGVDGGF